MKHIFITMLATICLLMLLKKEGYGIPAFARKYQTSCQTCHVAFPKLNPFGEAFRQNGFYWPGEEGSEEDNTKDEPVELGAESYKRVFPDAVWPGSIPGSMPLSFRARSGFRWQDDNGDARTSFELPTLQAMMAGTMGDNVGFFVGAHIFEDGSFGNASVDRFYLRLNDVLGDLLPENSFDFRIGQFIPEMVTFASNHRGLTETSYAFNTYSPQLGAQFSGGHIHGGDVGDHSDEEPFTGPTFGIEFFQIGAEASGILNSRFRYVLGFVNGGVDEELNDAKDGYARLAYKFGGMGYDGSDAPETAKNWIDNSVALGLFGYRGAAMNEGTFGPRDLKIERLGVDRSWYWENLNLYGGFMRGRDQMLRDVGVEKVDFNMWFAEANYVLFSWLLGVVRYEQADPEGFDPIRRVVPNLTVLYRANIKFIAETRINPDDFHFSALFLGIDFAY